MAFKEDYLNSKFLPSATLLVSGFIYIAVSNLVLVLFHACDFKHYQAYDIANFIALLPFRLAYCALLFAALFQLRRKMWLAGIINLAVAILGFLIRANINNSSFWG